MNETHTKIAETVEGNQDNLFQPGDYVVEITDLGLESDPKRLFVYYVDFVPQALVGRENEGLVYRTKRHVQLDDGGVFFRSPTTVYADGVLRCMITKSHFDGQLIGQKLHFQCKHVTINGRVEEKWLCITTRRRCTS